jgi:hypothetical protein
MTVILVTPTKLTTEFQLRTNVQRPTLNEPVPCTVPGTLVTGTEYEHLD